MNQNLRKIPVFIILVVILYGCGNAESTVSETTTNSIVENSQTTVSDNISEDSQQPDIDNLIKKSTSITLFLWLLNGGFQWNRASIQFTLK